MTPELLVEPIELKQGEVSLVPFQSQWIPQAWEWLNHDRNSNFDDYGPRTIEQFSGSLVWRLKDGQRIAAIIRGDKPVGMVGWKQPNDRLAMFAGLCVAPEAQKQQVGTIAVGMLLLSLWADGYKKVEAAFFADNKGVARLFQKLGAIDEGLLFEHTVRNGHAIDVRLMGFMKGGK